MVHAQMSCMGMHAVAMVMVEGKKHAPCLPQMRVHVKPFLGTGPEFVPNL